MADSEEKKVEKEKFARVVKTLLSAKPQPLKKGGTEKGEQAPLPVIATDT